MTATANNLAYLCAWTDGAVLVVLWYGLCIGCLIGIGLADYFHIRHGRTR